MRDIGLDVDEVQPRERVDREVGEMLDEAPRVVRELPAPALDDRVGVRERRVHVDDGLTPCGSNAHVGVVTDYRCRDEPLVPASPSRCFDALADLGTYARWWTLVAVKSDGPTRLAPGVRPRFAGARPGGERVEWPAEVLEAEPPARIELAYTGGEYEGRTGWEVVADGDGARVAYVYRGVRPVSDSARGHFARWGTRLHGVAMQEDALAGLARFFGGPGAELDDAAWAADVRRRVAAGIRALEVA